MASLYTSEGRDGKRLGKTRGGGKGELYGRERKERGRKEQRQAGDRLRGSEREYEE